MRWKIRIGPEGTCSDYFLYLNAFLPQLVIRVSVIVFLIHFRVAMTAGASFFNSLFPVPARRIIRVSKAGASVAISYQIARVRDILRVQKPLDLLRS